jgi:L-alanine-DL-glutamate epimerase-like enolase superfamily enzyme
MAEHRIERVELFPVRIPYPRPVQWAGLAEDAADYMVLRLVTDSGIDGVAEGTVKATWTSTTLRSLAVAFEELFMPGLKGLDIDDEKAVAALWRPREHSLAKAMIDVALWDIRAQVAAKPLWQLWGGRVEAAVSWVVTRQPPAQMAAEATDMVARHGFDTLKVKGGQGIATDVAVISEIRAAVGDGVRIYVDPNQEYTPEQAPDYCRRLAELGVLMVEDPCPYLPDAAFTRLQQDCALPVLVDNTCRDFPSARLYVERGAQAINLKLLKARGYTENWRIARHAAAHNVDVNIGLFGESSLGALAALQISASLPQGRFNLPSEATLFLLLPDEYVHEPLRVRDGRIRLPDAPGFGRVVDWDKVRRLAP